MSYTFLTVCGRAVGDNSVSFGYGDETDNLSIDANSGMIGSGTDLGRTGVDSDNEDSVTDRQQVISDDIGVD